MTCAASNKPKKTLEEDDEQIGTKLFTTSKGNKLTQYLMTYVPE
jgi:hypothetical protein